LINISIIGHNKKMNIFSDKRPKHISLNEPDKLAACPDTPNCVCSQLTKKQHSIPAIRINNNSQKPMLDFRNVLTEITGITIISATEDYLYAECKSPLLGFVDDLEFLLDHEKNVWHVRSASRLGYYDFGKNRNRIEKIRQLLAQNP
jgi:uncharacterized protein (DUF1499 family)